MLSGGLEDWDALEEIAHEQALTTRVRELEDKSIEILSAASEATRLLQENYTQTHAHNIK
jgi:acylphosphatase